MKAVLISAIVAAFIAAGAAGATSSPGYTKVAGSVSTIQSGSTGFSDALCPTGTQAVGGGYVASPGAQVNISVARGSGLQDWYVTASNGGSSPITLRAFAICS